MTWLLSQTETLCILRYIEGSHGEAKEQGEPKEEDMREDGEEFSQVPAWPDDPDPGPDDPANPPESTRRCTSKPDHPDGVPDHPDPVGHPDSPPDIRDVRTLLAMPGPSRPSPGSPGSLKPVSPGSPSGSSGPPPVRACWAEAHVPLRPLSLYKRLFLYFSRVSKGLAHLGDRALLIHLVPSP